MDTNWLSVGGVEVVNSARVRAYAAGCGGTSLGCACPGLAQAIEGQDYPGYGEDPVLDSAPWVDPIMPESGDFLGVLGLTAEGLQAGTASRTPTDLALGGANIGAVRYTSREISWTVTLVARTQAGMAYGLAWLEAMLVGDDGCFGTEACIFAWCPTDEADGNRAVRHLFDVGLLEGPTVTETLNTGSVWLSTVEFTLVAGNSYLYGEPYIQLGNDSGVRDIITVPPGGIGADCPDAPTCPSDPFCPPPPLPPLPPTPTDPCWPLTGFQAQRVMYTVPPGGVARIYSTVPVIRIQSGSAPLRRISVRFYENGAGADCSRWTDRCQACGEANIASIPAGSHLVMDGRQQRTQLDCSGGEGLAVTEPVPFGPNGGLFQWPVIDCASGLCIEVLWQRQGAAQDVTVEIDMVARQAVV